MGSIIGSIDIFLFYSYRPKNANKSQQASLTSPVGDEDWTWSTLACIYSSYAVICGTAFDVDPLKKLFKLHSAVVIFHLYIFYWSQNEANQLCIIAGDLGRRWLNMVGYWHLHLYSPKLFIWSYRLIIVLSLCLKEDGSQWMKILIQWPPSEALLSEPSDICCGDCIHEQLYCDSSDVTTP